MGTRFRVGNYKPGETKLPPPCPNCGAGNGTHGDPSCTYRMPDGMECMGYGDTSNGIPGDDEMDVSGEGARIIIRDLLNYGSREKDIASGSLDPADVLIRLTTAEFRITTLTSPWQDNGGIHVDENGVRPCARTITAGFDEDRLQRYVDNLRTLAEKAIEAGEEITYA